MTATLHLGVVDIPYADPSPPAPRRKAAAKRGRAVVRRRGGGAKKVQTTGDVAAILEAKYGVMDAFLELHGDDITEALTESLVGAIEGLVSGAPADAHPYAAAEALIGEQFREFIDSEEMNGRPGVPTEASLKGVSHRFKHPYAKGHPPRPSFVDTGLFRDSFTAWVDQDASGQGPGG